MERLGLGFETLTKKNPRLVYLSITGYGQHGRYRSRAGHDINYMAVAGALREEVPRIQFADLAGGGLYGALALVAGLHKSATSGKGSYIDLAMVDGVVSLLALAMSPIGEVLSGRFPNYGLYETRDGRWLSVGAFEPKLGGFSVKASRGRTWSNALVTRRHGKKSRRLWPERTRRNGKRSSRAGMPVWSWFETRGKPYRTRRFRTGGCSIPS